MSAVVDVRALCLDEIVAGNGVVTGDEGQVTKDEGRFSALCQ